MLELFCRAPDGIKLVEGSHLTPIPLDEAVASLSAILLDDDYYAFIMAGRKESDGLPWVGEDRLIPLKASAWLDLNARHAKGEAVDAKTIRKHANDVMRLAQLLSAHTTCSKDRQRSQSFSRRPHVGSLDRSELAQAEQHRCGNSSTHCAGLRTLACGACESYRLR